MNIRTPLAIFGCMLALIAGSRSASAQSAMNYKTAATTKFGTLPVLPSCMTLAIQEGDPAKGTLVVLAKFTPGCVVPWHWHSANERLLVVSGTAKGEMKGGDKPVSLKPGDYILLPAKGIHQFSAVTNVELFLLSDNGFDIHYTDAAGKEIPVEQVIKPAPAK